MSANLLAATAVTPQILCSTRPSGTSATTVFTCPASSATVIKQGTLCNTTGSAVTVSLSVVPSGGSVDGTHMVVSSYSLAANESLSLADHLRDAMLGPGDFVSVTTSTANAVAVVLSGTVSA